MGLIKLPRGVVKKVGLLLTLGLFWSFTSLHGCAQRYSGSTQEMWLESSQVDHVVHQVALQSTPDNPNRNAITRVAGRLESPLIRELSGMAASRNNPGVFWAINDSNNIPELFAIKANGKHLATYNLPVKNRDWEDMASFTDKGESWLLVAETGDNSRRYQSSTLYFLKEPGIPQVERQADLFSAVEFVYEDGPQNVESVAVSVDERQVFFISKNAGLPKIYALPLDLAYTSVKNNSGTGKPHVAKLLAEIPQLSWTDDDRWIEKRLASGILLNATSFDISANESHAVIGNYRHAYLIDRKPGQSWLQALQSTPIVITTHRLAQSETVAFSDDEYSIVIGSEGRYAPILQVSTTTSPLAESDTIER